MELTRKRRTFKFPFVPVVKQTKVRFVLTSKSGKKTYVNAKQGDIVTRRVWKNSKIYIHYGFIHGRTRNGLLVWENNTNGVECVYWEDFMSDKTAFKIIPTNVSYEKVLKRAKKRANMGYHFDRNNCEHFVNYSIYGIAESIQSKNTRLAVDVGLSIFETYLQFSSQSKKEREMFYNVIGNLRDNINLSRSLDFDRAVKGGFR